MTAIIKRVHVRVGEPSATEPVRAPGAGPARSARAQRQACRKEVELLRVEGRVHALELRCSCGEKTLVELDYDDRAHADPGSGPPADDAKE